MTTRTPLAGARVRRLDMPSPDLLAVTLGGAGWKEVLLVSLREKAFGVGLVSERPRGEPADGFVRKLRKELGNASVEHLDVRAPHAPRFVFRRGAQRWSLVAEASGPGAALVLLDESDRVVMSKPPGTLRARGLRPRSTYVAPEDGPPVLSAVPEDESEALRALRDAGAQLRTRRGSSTLHRQRSALRRALKKALQRVDRKLAAIQGDAARAETAPRLRAEASTLVANLHRLGPEDTELTATDWHADPPKEITLSIDPELGARAQAERLFQRARRLERGVEIATSRHQAALQEREALDALRAEVEQAEGSEALASLAERAAQLGVRGAREAAVPPDRHAPARRGPPPRRPFRRFVGTAGRTILVGRGAADNDALTLRWARPQDLWLHARDTRGAHVIVPLQRGETCPADLLVDAATLAAHFSDVRSEPAVDVQYTPRRFVRKPRGAPAGAVLLDREKVFALRVEPARLERLLASEQRDE